MKLVLPNLHLVKSREEQGINWASIIDQYPLDVEISDGGGHNKRVVMGEMKVSQILIEEGYGMTHLGWGLGEIVNFLFYLALCFSSVSLPQQRWTFSWSKTSMDGLDVSSSRPIVDLIPWF